MKLRKLTRENTKVFEGVLRDCLRRCLDEGYLPAYPEEILIAVDENLLRKGMWYDSGLIFYNSGKIKFGVKKDFEKLLKENNGRLACLNFNNSGLGGGNNFISYGRFAGVKK